jgi:outer membrane protein TolC
VADFLTVLVAQSTLLAAELQLAQSTTTVSSNLVALYKALGGGWETDMPVAPPPKMDRIPAPSLLSK